MALQLFQVVAQRSQAAEIPELAQKFYKADLFEESFGYYTFASEMVTILTRV